jgi:hypothetical protein
MIGLRALLACILSGFDQLRTKLGELLALSQAQVGYVLVTVRPLLPGVGPGRITPEGYGGHSAA